MQDQKKRLLLTNGRSPTTLYVARLLHARGHEVYITDPQKLHYCIFSNCVKKNFLVPSPRYQPQEFISKMIKIVNDYAIDMIIPTWEDVLLFSKNKNLFPKSCNLFVSDFDLLTKIHNKWTFINFLNDLGFETPKTSIVCSMEDLKQIDIPLFALKPGFSRSSKNVYKVKQGGPYPPIFPSVKQEWIAQEWLTGTIYCTYTICHEGAVFAHSTYPMEFIKNQEASTNTSIGSYCLSFGSIHHEKILLWTEEFVKKTHFTGQIALDFFELESGEIYAFECNPRLTSGAALFAPNDCLDQAFLGTNTTPIYPSNNSFKQVLSAMLFLGWKPAIICKKFPLYLKKLLSATDIIFHWNDLKPFLFQPLIMIKCIWQSLRKKSPIASSFTDDLDYNGETV